jgi:hypothetical protein
VYLKQCERTVKFLPDGFVRIEYAHPRGLWASCTVSRHYQDPVGYEEPIENWLARELEQR